MGSARLRRSKKGLHGAFQCKVSRFGTKPSQAKSLIEREASSSERECGTLNLRLIIVRGENESRIK